MAEKMRAQLGKEKSKIYAIRKISEVEPMLVETSESQCGCVLYTFIVACTCSPARKNTELQRFYLARDT